MLSSKRIAEKRDLRGKWPARNAICLITFINSQLFIETFRGQKVHYRSARKTLLIQKRKKSLAPPSSPGSRGSSAGSLATVRCQLFE
jgi:hypothetical protein